MQLFVSWEGDGILLFQLMLNNIYSYILDTRRKCLIFHHYIIISFDIIINIIVNIMHLLCATI